MSSIYKRGNFYQIAFTKRVAGKSVSKRFSLGVKSKRRAQKKQIEYDELYEAGKIDPFNGWSVKDHERDKTPSYVTLGKLIGEFHAKNTHKADATIKNYKYILEDFKKGVGDSMPVSAITDQHVRDFCFRDSLAPASQANYLRHLKVFFSWLEKEGYTKSDVTHNIKKPKFSKNIADKTITQEKRDRIFQAFDKDMAKKSHWAIYIMIFKRGYGLNL